MTHHEESEEIRFAAAHLRHLYKNVMARPDSGVRTHDAGMLTFAIQRLEGVLKARDQDAADAIEQDAAERSGILTRQGRREENDRLEWEDGDPERHSGTGTVRIVATSHNCAQHESDPS